MVFDLLAKSLRGRAPHGRVPDGTRVYAIGDIHGCLDQLQALHRMILEDAAEAEVGRLVVVYVGDYIDRGLDSMGVVDHLIGAPLPGFEAVYLRGNHEDFLLEFLEDPRRIGYQIYTIGNTQCGIAGSTGNEYRENDDGYIVFTAYELTVINSGFFKSPNCHLSSQSINNYRNDFKSFSKS